jgi:hypothetical protein
MQIFLKGFYTFDTPWKMKVKDSSKRSSLLMFTVNSMSKTFCRTVHKKECHFHPSPVFAGNAEAYPSVVDACRILLYGKALSLVHYY